MPARKQEVSARLLNPCAALRGSVQNWRCAQAVLLCSQLLGSVMWISIEELLAKFVSCHENVKPPKLAGIPGLWEALGGGLGKGGRICPVPKLWTGHDLESFWLSFNHLQAGLVAYIGQQAKTAQQEWLLWGQSATMGGHLPNLLVLLSGALFRNTKCHFGQYFTLRVFPKLESNSAS